MALSSAEQQPIVEPGTAAAGPAAARQRHTVTWVWQITILSLALGTMLALALQMQFRLRKAGLSGSRFGARAWVAASLKDSNDRLQEEVRTLRRGMAEFESQMAANSSASGALTKEMQDLKLRAGLIAVHGPGLIITLRDSPKKAPAELDPRLILHDSDLNLIISELKAAGSEAIGISGADTTRVQRVTARTTIRCTGPGMDVNDTRLGAPYRIFAIGNPKELRAQLEMPHGAVKELGLDVLQMIIIQESDRIAIPEYTGSYLFKYAQPADPPG